MTIANLPILFGEPEGPDGEAMAREELLPPGRSELGIDEALQLAVRMHREGRLDGARMLYLRVLEVVPEHPDAMAMLGVVEHQLGHNDEAVRLLREAAERVPGFMGFHLNLGNVLASCNRLEEALQSYEKALELAPHEPDLHNNFGAVLQALKRWDDARAAFDRALALDAGHVRAWNNLGLLHEALGDTPASIRAYLKALDLSPGHGISAIMLGRAFFKLGQREKAIEVFRQWMLQFPDDPTAKHMLAAASGEGVPERAADDYIEQHFDSFAASFEQVLNERLDYRAPLLCAQMLGQCAGEPARALEVLDIGCGTGLCGPLIAPWARRLVGVDLSAGMLMRARSKGVYDELVKAELTAFLRSTPDVWDAAVCADTLCYFGDLHDAMAAAATSLRAGAVLVFTVEALADDGAGEPKIQHHGRYAHGSAHIEHAIVAAGLTMEHARREVLRQEGGEPVHGWLLAVRRPR